MSTDVAQELGPNTPWEPPSWPPPSRLSYILRTLFQQDRWEHASAGAGNVRGIPYPVDDVCTSMFKLAKALPFHASTRIRLKNKGQIKDSKKNVIGMTILAQVIKNRLGPPLRKAEFPLYFESGVDDEGSWLQVLKEHKIAKVGGAWYTMENHKGEEIKFQSKEWSQLLEDDEFKSHCYKMICDKVILKYSKADLGIDDVEITDEVLGD